MPINYNKYPNNWAQIRQRILKRADNCCEKCGLANYQYVYSLKTGNTSLDKKEWYEDFNEAKSRALKTGWLRKDIEPNPKPIIRPVKVVLTIAHLDHDEANADVKDERLMAMCQKCHLRYDAKEKSGRVLGKK